jgi:DNA-binding transcriptional ArsR family regulator
VLVLQDPAAAVCLLHPLRRRVVEHLAEPDTAAGVARHLRLPRQKVNYHLRELERHGLLRLVREVRHGAGTERHLQAVARGFLLGPRLLGKLAADRTATDSADPPERLLAAASRMIREVEASPPDTAEDRLIALEADLRFPDEEALHSFAGELLAEIDRLAEKYRDPSGPVTRAVVGLHPAPGFGSTLPR